MKASRRHHIFSSLFAIVLLMPAWIFAQLKADFSLDKTGGCAPLVVTFSNRTTGASANAKYEWNFGNGNTSGLQNPAASFYDEKTYSVTLTVKDGAQVSTQTKTITVYPKPAASFNFSPAVVCMPAPVTFTSTGNTSSYQWDFGDGSTELSYNNTVSHYYTFEQLASVSLTVKNEYGCVNTVTQKDIIKVNKTLIAGFSASKTMVCYAPEAITFTNTSTGPGTLSYLWNFGDGTTSTATTPTHTYTQKGIYTVSLTVTSSEGCVKTETKSAYINVENFVADFDVPALMCSQTNFVLTNKSFPIPDQSTWVIDGTTTLYTYSNSALNYSLPAGTHTIQLTSNFGGYSCQRTITKQIEVKASPVLNGFVQTITGNCGAPVQVNFSDTTASAVSWQWYFNYWQNSYVADATTKSPSHTYTYDNVYQVVLSVANADGCRSSVSKTVGISRPAVGIFLHPDSRVEACGSNTVTFETRTTDPIVDYKWNFGDGGQSIDPTPTHTFSKPGIYPVTLTYKTAAGCTGTATYNNIIVRQKPVANFSVQPEVCGNTPVNFINLSTGYAVGYLWNYGDNSGDIWSSSNMSYQYQSEGTFSVRLIAANGMCNDTITKTNIIKVSPPFAKIAAVQNTCDGTRGLVTFTDASRDAERWQWNFGDGTIESYTTAKPQYSHVYTKTGSYKVVLSVQKGSCIVKDSTTVYVLLKQSPVLTLDKPSACITTQVPFHIRGLDNNPAPYNYYNAYDYVKLEYGDGSTFNGLFYNYNYWYTNADGNISSHEVKDDKLRVIMRSYMFGCLDTTNYVPISFRGVVADFEIQNNDVCYQTPISFKDLSQPSANYPITSWTWNFGDGQSQTSTTGGVVKHTYANPGYYYVSLTITDAGGCTINTSSSKMVYVSGPKAAFSVSSGNSVQLNTTVTFYNNTNNFNSPNTTWEWNLGNGVASTDYSPTYTYTVPGEYEITLVATNPVTGCKSSYQQKIIVKDFNTGFVKNSSFIGNYSNCPPVLVRFTNTSSNYTRLVWDFGDGTILENQYAPSHVYNKTGKYYVTLQVYGYNGLSGTFKDSVIVGQPLATIAADDIAGCIGHNVLLNAPMHNAVTSYTWDFGNGNLINTIDSFATGQYLQAGSYGASLIIKDQNGCQQYIPLANKIVINPDPVAAINASALNTCKDEAVKLQASGGVQYNWTATPGLSDYTIAAPMALPLATTRFAVKVTDANGCTDTTSIAVIVPEPIYLSAKKEYDICKGSSAQMNATGAATYRWIGSALGLNNLSIPNPVASPNNSTSYTLVGYDMYNCYTDTAAIVMNVRPLPTVNAGPDREVSMGSENTLTLATSNDVVKWQWTPSSFLSCTNCPAPISKPYGTTTYMVTVFNQFNCEAKDTVIIKAFCKDAGVYIPDAFTPNNDGKNDVFAVTGTGIGKVRSFVIYNRWGEMIFQKKNFFIGDITSAWNGKYKGVEAPVGAYVYFAELECDAGQVIQRKGTVTLIR